MARAPFPHKNQPPKQRIEPDAEKVAGLPAVRAVLAHDPGRILRLFLDERMKDEAADVCKVLAAAHKSYRLVSSDELGKILGSPLHGGIVAVTKPKPIRAFDPLDAHAWAKEGKPLIVLDGVGNPHNLGAIARTMAFFALPRLLLSDHPGQAQPSEAALRVSEGGLEWVEVIQAKKFVAALKRLRDSHRIIGTALGSGKEVGQVLRRPGKPIALILGNEEEGLPPATLAACDEVVTLPGSGRIQSLNVAATAAILIHELVK